MKQIFNLDSAEMKLFHCGQQIFKIRYDGICIIFVAIFVADGLLIYMYTILWSWDLTIVKAGNIVPIDITTLWPPTSLLHVSICICIWVQYSSFGTPVITRLNTFLTSCLRPGKSSYRSIRSLEPEIATLIIPIFAKRDLIGVLRTNLKLSLPLLFVTNNENDYGPNLINTSAE